MATKGKKGRKVGRNLIWCREYRNRDQRGVNKALKIMRHIRRYGDDPCAQAAYDKILTPSREQAQRIRKRQEKESAASRD